MLMKKIGGGIETGCKAIDVPDSAYALYKCPDHDIVHVRSGFHGIIFATWEDAPNVLDLGCLNCNLRKGA